MKKNFIAVYTIVCPYCQFKQTGIVRVYLSHKNAVKLIGNAVPPEWAKILIRPQVNSMKEYKSIKMTA